MRDPYTYFALAFFIAFINFLACGQRLLDSGSRFRKKLFSALLYALMLTILFALPLLFGISEAFLVTGLIVGYLHFFHDLSALKKK